MGWNNRTIVNRVDAWLLWHYPSLLRRARLIRQQRPDREDVVSVHVAVHIAA